MIGDSQAVSASGSWSVMPMAKSVLTHIRSFQLGDDPITQIIPEERRKGFCGPDSEGRSPTSSTAPRTAPC